MLQVNWVYKLASVYFYYQLGLAKDGLYSMMSAYINDKIPSEKFIALVINMKLM